MTDETGRAGRFRWLGHFFSPSFGIPLLVFVLGLLTGFPIAIFGFDILVQHAATAFALLIGLLFLVVIVSVLILAFRRPIWQRVFGHAEVELERMAQPMGEVVRLAAGGEVAEASRVAGDLARFVAARYAWIATRRWIIAAVTGFVAVIAALAGSALLFQQNQLLRIQSDLMREQTMRLNEQTVLLDAQIQLGEAQRSTSIVPEILAIGAALAEQVAAARPPQIDADDPDASVAAVGAQLATPFRFSSADLGDALRGRIIAATTAARPYRYLGNPLEGLSDDEISALAFGRRTDLTETRQRFDLIMSERAAQYGGMLPSQRDDPLVDRIVSPERGQILAMLYNAGVADTEVLSHSGADFSFAEVRIPALRDMSLRHAMMRYSDLSRREIVNLDLRGAYLDHSRWRSARIAGTDFSSIANEEVALPFGPHPSLPYWPGRLIGSDFAEAQIERSAFIASVMIAADFDRALIAETDFSIATLATATFRNAILHRNDFSGADLTNVDFDGAVVFEPGFLDGLAEQAAEGTFRRDLFGLDPVGDEILPTHPNFFGISRLAGVLVDTQTYRVRRLGPFE
ncbi:pentapeptide repeat-containing protein [Arsenicitalea aurantiaca]|uniref:Pentapeptide repeat-containing protein n=1 Tax=Arsenicitalea aurantiaca TaxID=1783274 RepID=A0A433XLY6_9HYPH|nr:pentapeptide repeat-containing protein [Arsenicitalea aurantiaca]RUT35100.1 pentapeptide repeat-containing protein [Arsenicitalea aurantiaca]